MTLDMAKGKRIGTRRAARRRSLPDRTSLLLCLGLTLCVVAWGYQVFAAIDFGTSARGGETAAWGFLALACAGAAVCLFVGLMIGARLVRRLGVTAPDAPAPAGGDLPPETATEDAPPAAPTYTPPPGPYRGKRIAR